MSEPITLYSDGTIRSGGRYPEPMAATYRFGDCWQKTTPGGNECHLAIETAHGWTVAPLTDDCWGNGRYYRRLGIQELGVGRGDLALVRPTWMPSILTEGMFLMIPEQENALRSASGQRLYAQAVYDGTLAFLRDRARAQPGRPSRP